MHLATNSEQVLSVANELLYIAMIALNNCDSDDFDFGRCKRQHECPCIVDTRIRIDDNLVIQSRVGSLSKMASGQVGSRVCGRGQVGSLVEARDR